ETLECDLNDISLVDPSPNSFIITTKTMSEPFLGFKALVPYFDKDSTEWSYPNFLYEMRNAILDIEPFDKDWERFRAVIICCIEWFRIPESSKKIKATSASASSSTGDENAIDDDGQTADESEEINYSDTISISDQTKTFGESYLTSTIPTTPSPSSPNYKQPRFITSNENMDMDYRIMNVLEQPVKFIFEEKMKKYKPQRFVLKKTLEILKYLNVKLGKALSSITINYENPNRNTVYLHNLFDKFGEVISKAQKLLRNKSSKKPKYDGDLSFNRKIEFIYVETATTSILSKRDKDLSKMHEAIAIMFKFIVSSLPEKLVYEISELPILCIQFCVKMCPVVFSIMNFDILEQVAFLPSLTKSASLIQDLHKRYQLLLKNISDYYLDNDNNWTSLLKLKTR
ncbi:5899_t:CDS:10, partial [Funneliformis geosporum]